MRKAMSEETREMLERGSHDIAGDSDYYNKLSRAIDDVLDEVDRLKPLAEIGAALNQVDVWEDMELKHVCQLKDRPPHWVVVRHKTIAGCFFVECGYPVATIREALASAGLMGEEHDIDKVQEARDNARPPDSPIGRRVDR